jgi:Domain of unknown function (DUF4136)
MKAILNAVAAATLLIASPSLAGPKASANADTSVDLRQFQTFGWANPIGTDQNGYQSILSQNLKASTQRQLEARGLRYDATNPQLLVNFNARLDDKMKVTNVPTPTMTMGVGYGRGYYGYRGGMYGTYPMYQDQTTVSQYKEGTLNIDIVDTARKQLVWEAVVSDTITQKKRDNMQKTVDDYMKAAFKKFPIPATK